jgi:hypothetical protein
MSDETLTDEVLEDLRTKALAAQPLPPQVVLALIDEVRRLRAAEPKQEEPKPNYDWVTKARREGTAVLLGKSGWSLPPRLKGEPEK